MAGGAAPSSREKILDVAEALFARRGYAGVGLREVAEAAGLSKSSLFHHFRGKAPLYCEVLHRVLRRIDERLIPAVHAALPPERRLDRWVEALVDALAEHPGSARLLLRGLFEDDEFLADPPPEAEAAERRLASILQGIRSLLREGVDGGAFRSVSIPDTLQTLIGATVYHFASGEVGEGVLAGPLFSAEAVRRRKREIVRLLHSGLDATGAPGRVDAPFHPEPEE
jgi:TetR/AcrR family transcriptional regulator